MSAVLIARYYVKPGNSQAVREALGKMAARVKADEPACLVYNANVDPQNENLYCLYEIYKDEAALVAHRETLISKRLSRESLFHSSKSVSARSMSRLLANEVTLLRDGNR